MELCRITGVQALLEQLAFGQMRDKEPMFCHGLEAIAKTVEGEVRFFGALAEQSTKGGAHG
jgi:hypothetical protein